MYSPRFGPDVRDNQSEIATMELAHFRFSISDCRFEIARVVPNCQSKIGNWQSEMLLSLRELEALARTFLSVLLAFLDSRIARDQSGLLQGRSQIAVVFDQCARDAVTDRSRLSRRSTTRDINENVEFVHRLRHL